MIKDLIRTIRMRRFIKKQRKETGKCQTCGRTKKCEDWCWGPSVHSILWVAIKHPRPSLLRYLWSLLKTNLKWSGIEPWHRYE